MVKVLKWLRRGYKRACAAAENPDETSLWVRVIKRLKLDGLKMIVKEGVHLIEKTLYSIFFFYFLGYGIHLIHESVQKYMERPVLYVFYGQVPLEFTPFPAVTANQLHILKRSTIDEASEMHNHVKKHGSLTDSSNVTWGKQDTNRMNLVLYNLCQSRDSFSQKLDWADPDKSSQLRVEDVLKENPFIDDPDDTSFSKIITFIKKGLVNCTEFIPTNLWNGSPEYNSFIPTQTDMGTGCSYNTIPHKLLRKKTGLQHLINDYDQKPNGTNTNFLDWYEWLTAPYQFLNGKGEMGMVTTVTDVNTSLDGWKISDQDFREYPKIQMLPGQPNGLSMLLVQNVEEDDIACQVHDGAGFKVHLHSPVEEARPKARGFVIPFNHEVFIEFTPVLTLADPAINKMELDDIKCHHRSKNPLTRYAIYTVGNCLNECHAVLMLNNCGCVDLGLAAGNKEKICGPADDKCVKNLMANIRRVGNARACSTIPNFPKCYSGCSEIEYEVKVTPIPYSESTFFSPEALEFIKNKNSTLAHVFCGAPAVITRIRQGQYSLAEIFGIIGGILGLTNGFSFMNVLDVGATVHLIVVAVLKSIQSWINRRLMARRRAVAQGQILRALPPIP